MQYVRPITRSKIKQKNGYVSTIEHDPITVKIDDDPYITKFVQEKRIYKSTIEQDFGNVKINEVLPFRIKFINMGVTGYSVPPIGIAIIGYSNYIL
jgi:hypothetical protein